MSRIDYSPAEAPAVSNLTVEVVNGVGFVFDWNLPEVTSNYGGIRIYNGGDPNSGFSYATVEGQASQYIWTDTPSPQASRTFTIQSLDANKRVTGAELGPYGPYDTPSPPTQEGSPGQIVFASSTTSAIWQPVNFNVYYTYAFLDLPGNGKTWVFEGNAMLDPFSPVFVLGNNSTGQVNYLFELVDMTTSQSLWSSWQLLMGRKTKTSGGDEVWYGNMNPNVKFSIDTESGHDYRFYIKWIFENRTGTSTVDTVWFRGYSLSAQELL